MSELKLLTASLAGGELREGARFRRETSSFQSLQFSADGKFAFFPSKEQNGGPIRIDLATGKISPLGAPLQDVRNIAVHPSGRRMAIQTGAPEKEIWIAENILPR